MGVVLDAFDWIAIEPDEEHLKRERAKARELRASAWWKQQTAQGKCHYCGASVPPKELTMDHRIPVARGGKSVRGNVVPACKACNSAKRCLTPAEQILSELTPAASDAAPRQNDGAAPCGSPQS